MELINNNWVESICDELNNQNLNLPQQFGGGKCESKKFKSLNQFIKEYITIDSGIYNHLNSKGLINRGFCPVTGDSINNLHSYEIFGRKVFLSEKGIDILKEYDRLDYIRLYGKEPMSDSENQMKLLEMQKTNEHQNFNSNIFAKITTIAVIVILIIYLFKKC